jgi:hypothetical protein
MVTTLQRVAKANGQALRARAFCPQIKQREVPGWYRIDSSQPFHACARGNRETIDRPRLCPGPAHLRVAAQELLIRLSLTKAKLVKEEGKKCSVCQNNKKLVVASWATGIGQGGWPVVDWH